MTNQLNLYQRKRCSPITNLFSFIYVDDYNHLNFVVLEFKSGMSSAKVISRVKPTTTFEAYYAEQEQQERKDQH